MVGDGGQRLKRLLDMLDTIAEHPRISTGTLGKAAQRKFNITNRTAQDYIDALVAFRWANNINGLLEVTRAGRKALLNSDDPEAHPIEDPIPEVSTAVPEPPPPPPPSSSTGGEG